MHNYLAGWGEPLEEDTYDPETSPHTCPECQQEYSGAQRAGGHCRGGRYGGCCQSFGSQNSGDKHRVGPHEPRGSRRCLTPDEMRAKGWTQDDRGAWRTPAPKTNPWTKAPNP
jgi:hypothetical protein